MTQFSSVNPWPTALLPHLQLWAAASWPEGPVGPGGLTSESEHPSHPCPCSAFLVSACGALLPSAKSHVPSCSVPSPVLVPVCRALVFRQTWFPLAFMFLSVLCLLSLILHSLSSSFRFLKNLSGSVGLQKITVEVKVLWITLFFLEFL